MTSQGSAGAARGLITHSVWVSLQPHWESRSANIWHFKADRHRDRRLGWECGGARGKGREPQTEGDEDVLVPKPEEAPQPPEVIPSPPSDEEVPCTS